MNLPNLKLLLNPKLFLNLCLNYLKRQDLIQSQYLWAKGISLYNIYLDTVKCTELKMFISVILTTAHTLVESLPQAKSVALKKAMPKGTNLSWISRWLVALPVPITVILCNTGKAGDGSYPRSLEARTTKHDAFPAPLGKREVSIKDSPSRTWMLPCSDWGDMARLSAFIVFLCLSSSFLSITLLPVTFSWHPWTCLSGPASLPIRGVLGNKLTLHSRAIRIGTNRLFLFSIQAPVWTILAAYESSMFPSYFRLALLSWG